MIYTMESGDLGKEGGRRRSLPTLDDSAKKRQYGKRGKDLEMDIYNDHTILAKGDWEGVPEPWTASIAVMHIGFPHLDRW